MYRVAVPAVILFAVLSFASLVACAHEIDEKPAPVNSSKSPTGTPAKKLDFTGLVRKGKASFYAPQFAGRKMANGQRMDPHGSNAASLTLPLGTTARVTNMKTGQSAVVTIQDRGPYVKGRIVDLSPATARDVGITPKDGVAPVEVAPIAVPQPDGSVKLGEAATTVTAGE